jgi:hypothetical protein
MIGESAVRPKDRRRKATSGQGLSVVIGYNPRSPFSRKARIAMEAEQLNQIAARLDGLRARTADLRRYL